MDKKGETETWTGDRNKDRKTGERREQKEKLTEREETDVDKKRTETWRERRRSRGHETDVERKTGDRHMWTERRKH